MLASNNSLVLGMMSGTSLDGLDIAACKFWEENNQWKFEIIKATTFEYSPNEIAILKNAFSLSGSNLISLHHQYGSLLGKKAKYFCDKHQLKPNFIASHGHTVFHQPNNKFDAFNPSIENSTTNGFTFQLGHGANIAAVSGLNTVCDFRTSDVAYGGQGAPLVPIGDELLFSQYNYCLNLGGISNISFNKDGKRKAFDIGICNMALNELAQQAHLNFDKDGLIAQSGKIEDVLLEQLLEAAAINHLNQHSLGYEWYANQIKPILDTYNCALENKLRTYCEFIAIQIGAAISINNTVLITGGGAKNNFLINCIQQNTNCKIIIPDEQLIDFKEALIFAFLGLLRINHQANSLSEVTSAKKNSIGACIYLT
jgi:anhydro-N-acetylmuramic acid kinase